MLIEQTVLIDLDFAIICLNRVTIASTLEGECVRVIRPSGAERSAVIAHSLRSFPSEQSCNSAGTPSPRRIVHLGPGYDCQSS